MLTFPIRTDRFDLVPLDERHREAFVAYRRDPLIARWQSWTPDFSAADADALLGAQPRVLEPGSGDWLQVAVCERSSGRLVGDLGVHALAENPDTYELGVTVARGAQGGGVATEALRAMTGALFADQAAHRLTAITDVRNRAAATVFSRLGFRHEGRAIDADFFTGEWSSVDSWALLRREHERRR
ncbi:GNAT family N-acetyltransferase [Leifsonia aquatica]|uniref:GNAT family N-acetyltransferase n=1 Tax=Leifsonia aquatica TaxID=144185 RepID=UPI0005BAFABF|nr:GNAT family protein [Leifsonia aquatica]